MSKPSPPLCATPANQERFETLRGTYEQPSTTCFDGICLLANNLWKLKSKSCPASASHWQKSWCAYGRSILMVGSALDCRRLKKVSHPNPRSTTYRKKQTSPRANSRSSYSQPSIELLDFPGEKTTSRSSFGRMCPGFSCRATHLPTCVYNLICWAGC